MPSEVTGVERRALEDAAVRAGARRVYVIEEPMAAAIGADLPVNDTAASMVVDIGGGTTDVAVISLGGIVNARSVRVGGDEIDEAVVGHVRAEHSLLLGERSAEHIKVSAGSAFPLREELSTRVSGRDLVTGLPRTVTLSSPEIRRAIEGPVLQIVELVRTTLDVCPPELAGDILGRGIVLTGGGALLRGLDERMRHELGVPVRVADDPLRAVVRGSRPVRGGPRLARARPRRRRTVLTGRLHSPSPLSSLSSRRALGALVLVTVLVSAADLARPASTSVLRGAAASALGPLERAVAVGGDARLARVTAERDELARRVAADRDAAAAGRRLTALLGSTSAARVVPARVIAFGGGVTTGRAPGDPGRRQPRRPGGGPAGRGRGRSGRPGGRGLGLDLRRRGPRRP